MTYLHTHAHAYAIGSLKYDGTCTYTLAINARYSQAFIARTTDACITVVEVEGRWQVELARTGRLRLCSGRS